MYLVYYLSVCHVFITHNASVHFSCAPQTMLVYTFIKWCQLYIELMNTVIVTFLAQKMANSSLRYTKVQDTAGDKTHSLHANS